MLRILSKEGGGGVVAHWRGDDDVRVLISAVIATIFSSSGDLAPHFPFVLRKSMLDSGKCEDCLQRS